MYDVVTQHGFLTTRQQQDQEEQREQISDERKPPKTDGDSSLGGYRCFGVAFDRAVAATRTSIGFPNDDTTAVTIIAKEQQQSPSSSPSSKSSSSKSSFSSSSPYCNQTYFWGGGKAGSTTLFFLLTGGIQGQITTPFVSSNDMSVGKEPCFGGVWAKWEVQAWDQTICNSNVNSNGDSDSDSGKKMQHTHILNGCPRRTWKNHALEILALHTAEANANANTTTTETHKNHQTFLMLIQDPVNRLVSYINDNRRRGTANQRKCTVEEQVQTLLLNPRQGKITGLERILSYQGENLATLLSVIPDPSDVPIIPMESMSTPQTIQGVANAVSDHVGAARWRCLIITTIGIRITTTTTAATMFST